MKLSILIKMWMGAVLMLSPMLSQADAAKHRIIDIEYEVYKSDIPFATVKEQFVVDQQRYQLNSRSKGIGVFALLGERILTSQGKINQDGLVPSEFSLEQGGKLRKATFDWDSKTLTMQYKGKTNKDTLSKGAQDLASFVYQFQYNPPVSKKPYQLALTTGKRLKTYTYQVEAQDIELDGKPVKCLHLFEDKPGKESKEFWIAKDYAYLPVYIVLTDKHGQRLEQTLTKFKKQ